MSPSLWAEKGSWRVLFTISFCTRYSEMHSLNLNTNMLPKTLLETIAGGVAPSGHPNHFNDTKSCDYEEPSNRHFPHGETNLAVENSRCTEIGQGMVHVPNKHGSNEESIGLFGCRHPSRYTGLSHQSRYDCERRRQHFSDLCRDWTAWADCDVETGTRNSTHNIREWRQWED